MYELIKNYDGVKRLSDGAVIPSDTRNIDWLNYQTWLDEGNTPDPYPIENLRNERFLEVQEAGFKHIDSIGGDERNKMRTLMNAVKSIDSYTKPGGGTRNTVLDSLTSDADRIEQTHILIEQAKIELETHNDPENYPMPVWP